MANTCDSNNLENNGRRSDYTNESYENDVEDSEENKVRLKPDEFEVVRPPSPYPSLEIEDEVFRPSSPYPSLEMESTNVCLSDETYDQRQVTEMTVPRSEVKTDLTSTSGLPQEGKDCQRLISALQRLHPVLKILGVAAGVIIIILYLAVLIGHVKPKSNDEKASKSETSGDIGDWAISRAFSGYPEVSGYLDTGKLQNLAAITIGITKRSDWLAQSPVKGMRDLRGPVPIVIISHSSTEGCYTAMECAARIRTIQQFYIDFKRSGDIAYNFLVGGDGRVYEGRGWDTEGAHSLAWNSKSIGICIVGTFDTIAPSSKQLAATIKLIARGVALKKISQDYKLVAENQTQFTESPGRLAYSAIKRWPRWNGGTICALYKRYHSSKDHLDNHLDTYVDEKMLQFYQFSRFCVDKYLSSRAVRGSSNSLVGLLLPVTVFALSSNLAS